MQKNQTSLSRRFLVVRNLGINLNQARCVAQVSNKLKIVEEVVRKHCAKQRCQQPGTTIENAPQDPFFIFSRGTIKMFAKERFEGPAR
jgi:hypothetical protein